MEILDMIEELAMVERDILHRTKKLDHYYIYDFDQTWGSTALGFPGCGGSAITTARTYVLVPTERERAYVYFGGRFAYECGINDRFQKDLDKQDMASVVESTRYNE